MKNRTLGHLIGFTYVFFISIIVCLLMISISNAAENVSSTSVVSWNAPTTNTDGSALTNLKEHQLFVAQAAIPDSVSVAPTAKIAAGTNTFSYQATVANGATLFFRVRACNTADVCSALSAEITKKVSVLIPSVPSGVNVTVTVTISIPGS